MKTVLVIDDEAAIAMLISDILRDEGYEVFTASDGQQGLNCAREVRPDLVLSDIMMPHLDGHGLAAQMHADPALQAIPLVLMSAAPRSRPSPLSVAFMCKPFDLDDLVDLVQRLIGPQHVELAP